jgi:3-hydroxyisobutyrate dehydrogenase-like beta-hydroxyacid dehydrogenase
LSKRGRGALFRRRVKMSKPTIGFIGLGIMGKPMSRHLLKAGYPLVVHNRSRGAVKELAAEGAQEAHSCKEVAERSEVIISMVPDSPDVEAVALGPDGLIEGIKGGQIYIDMSTIAPGMALKVAEELGKKGVRCLDAPVSGGEVGAINATLSIMAATRFRSLSTLWAWPRRWCWVPKRAWTRRSSSRCSVVAMPRPG